MGGPLYEWTPGKLQSILCDMFKNCVTSYANFVLAISGKITDVAVDCINIRKLAHKNAKKSGAMGAFVHSTKKAFTKTKDRKASSQYFPINVRHALYSQKLSELCCRFESIWKVFVQTKKLHHKIKSAWFGIPWTQSLKDGSGIFFFFILFQYSISMAIHFKLIVIQESKSAQQDKSQSKDDQDHFLWLSELFPALEIYLRDISDLVATYVIYVEARLDIIDNLYSSQQPIPDQRLERLREEQRVAKQYQRHQRSQNTFFKEDKDENKEMTEPKPQKEAHFTPKNVKPPTKGGFITQTSQSLKLWEKFQDIMDLIKSHVSLDGFTPLCHRILQTYLEALLWVLLHSDKYRIFSVVDGA
ncbi:hypothetical protein RFI_09608 [Reticulomyxa filosa]|uniref:Uncharacterized protein n=1 Tax=Reticulomyxa filosa TaxID=46433 RepID=X6NQ87_RETFI|nr:hypothetical protein RFI_09608 [Reticulomyxa filosa]|eukprot:ETO27527.1 hypothetical protein RFI_09608 [Reticulomyxa filosa]